MFGFVKEFYYRTIYKKLGSSDNKVPIFSLNGKRVIAKVVDVYDGDSVTVVFKYNGKLRRFKIRMYGYDTPEIRTKDIQEKEAAIKARDILRTKILGKLVKLECGEFDKYGRLLGTIFSVSDDECINKFMVESKLGYEYFGKTKKEFNLSEKD